MRGVMPSPPPPSTCKHGVDGNHFPCLAFFFKAEKFGIYEGYQTCKTYNVSVEHKRFVVTQVLCFWNRKTCSVLERIVEIADPQASRLHIIRSARRCGQVAIWTQPLSHCLSIGYILIISSHFVQVSENWSPSLQIFRLNPCANL